MIAGGSIPKQRWEVCSMKSPWGFQASAHHHLVWESQLSLLEMEYIYL